MLTNTVLCVCVCEYLCGIIKHAYDKNVGVCVLYVLE